VYVTENRSVGGSIPPLGTMLPLRLLRLTRAAVVHRGRARSMLTGCWRALLRPNCRSSNRPNSSWSWTFGLKAETRIGSAGSTCLGRSG